MHHQRPGAAILVLLAFCALRPAAAQTGSPVPLHVTTCEMGFPQPDPGSLPEIMRTAPSGSVIVFDVDCQGGLNANPMIALAAPIVIASKSLTIDATGHTVHIGTCSGCKVAPTRLFKIGPAGTLKLRHVLLTTGKGDADVTPTQSLLARRFQMGVVGLGITTYGGVIYVQAGGTLEVDNSIVFGNYASEGGAIFNEGTTTIRNSEFANNMAGVGGAVSSSGDLTVVNSTMSGNGIKMTGTRSYGGAIFNYGTAAITNTTIADNSAYSGAGIYNEGTANVASSTIAQNIVRSDGGNPYTRTKAGVTNSGGTLTASNTIISGNLTYTSNDILPGPDCEGSLIDNANNISGDKSCGFSKNSPTGDAKLGALARNGGTTNTIALEAGSAAIAAGNPVNCTATDQRGQLRNAASRNGCDIGAFDTGGTPVPSVASITLSPGSPFFDHQSVTATITLANPAPPGGVTLTLLPTAVSLPASVTIPAGQTAVTIPFDTKMISVGLSDSISATYSGVTKSIPYEVHVAQLSDLTVTPQPVTSGSLATLTVTTDRPPPYAGSPITLTSSNAQIARVPPTLMMPNGATSTTVGFVPNTRNATSADTVFITARMAAGKKEVMLIVYPPGMTPPIAKSTGGRVKKTPPTRAPRTPPPSAPPPSAPALEESSSTELGTFRINAPGGVITGRNLSFCSLQSEPNTFVIIFTEGVIGGIHGKVKARGPGVVRIANDEEEGVTIALMKPDMTQGFSAGSGTFTITAWTRDVLSARFRFTTEPDSNEKTQTVTGSFTASAASLCAQ